MGATTFKRLLLLSHNKFVFQNNVHNNRSSSVLHVGLNKKRPVTRKKVVGQGCEVQSKPEFFLKSDIGYIDFKNIRTSLDYLQQFFFFFFLQ
jgi:hypothetical protein